MSKQSDSELRSQVEEVLAWEPSVTSNRIGVSCEDGVVTLSGHVSSWPEKWSAERAVKQTRGVRALANELDVDLPTQTAPSDTDIARAAVQALYWHTNVPDDAVQVTVKDGCIRLEGQVEHHWQRRDAEAAVHYLRGVRRVNNDIEVKAKVKVADVQRLITRALERSARLDAKYIQVEATGSKVTLSGKVPSWTEKEEAEEAAWAAPGVQQVDSRLSVAE